MCMRERPFTIDHQQVVCKMSCSGTPITSIVQHSAESKDIHTHRTHTCTSKAAGIEVPTVVCSVCMHHTPVHFCFRYEIHVIFTLCWHPNTKINFVALLTNALRIIFFYFNFYFLNLIGNPR